MPREPSANPALFADMAQVIWHGDRVAFDRLADTTGLAPEQAAARLHIHASTTRQTLTSALAEAVPSVATMLPPEDFAALAREFIACHPPARAALHGWGDDLPSFLETREAPSELVAMARLDRAWMVSFFAAEALPIAPARLAGLAPSTILEARLILQPSVQLVRLDGPWFEDWCARGALPQLERDREADANGDLVIVSRPQVRVRAAAVAPATFAFVAALRAGAPLTAACEAALCENGAFDLKAGLTRAFSDGLFAECLPME